MKQVFRTRVNKGQKMYPTLAYCHARQREVHAAAAARRRVRRMMTAYRESLKQRPSQPENDIVISAGLKLHSDNYRTPW